MGTEKRTADHDHVSREDAEIDDADAVTNRKIVIQGKRRTSFHEGKLSRMRSETMRADRLQRSAQKNADAEMRHRGGRFWAPKRTGYIDVWWLDDTGGLTILLPHILRKKKQWSGVPIRLFVLHTG